MSLVLRIMGNWTMRTLSEKSDRFQIFCTEVPSGIDKEKGIVLYKELRTLHYDCKKVFSMNQYLIIIEEGIDSFGAYAPDLPNCGVAVAKTIQKAVIIMQEITSTHLQFLEQHGEPIPIPSNTANAHHKTTEELCKLFLAHDPNWKFKSLSNKVSYFVPAKEENLKIQKLLQDLEEERKGDMGIRGIWK